MRNKWGALVIVISCMGTALAMAISSQDDKSVDVVDATTKNHRSSNRSGTDQNEQVPTDMSLDLTAIKRTMPGKIRDSSLLQSKSWYEPPSTPVANLAPTPPLPPPSAPQLPFIYIGRMIDGHEVILFLAINDQHYTAKLGDILGGTYRVDKITEKIAVFTYLPLSSQQELVFNSTAVGVSALSASEMISTTQPLMQPHQLTTTSR